MVQCLCGSVPQWFKPAASIPHQRHQRSGSKKQPGPFPSPPYRLGLPLCLCVSVVQCLCGSNRLPASPISDPALKNNRIFPNTPYRLGLPLCLCASVVQCLSGSVPQRFKPAARIPQSAPISSPALKKQPGLSQDPLHNAFKLCDAAGPDPFGDEYIPVAVKTSVMRMHELAIKPHLFVLPHTLGIPHSLDVTPKLR